MPPLRALVPPLQGPAVLVPQPVHHSPLAARSHAAVTAGVPQSRYQSRDYWSLQPLCRSLTAAAYLQRCHAAATGCSKAPVPSPIKGLLGPAVLVPQPVHHSPLAARSHAAVTAGVPQSRYQSRDYWSLPCGLCGVHCVVRLVVSRVAPRAPVRRVVRRVHRAVSLLWNLSCAFLGRTTLPRSRRPAQHWTAQHHMMTS